MDDQTAAARNTPTIAASNSQFDTSRLELPADTDVEIIFENNDAADTPHNVAIYVDETAADEIFRGDQVAGGERARYAIPATSGGEYFFRCDVHPTMVGTAVFG